jgi:hypothetical protein
VPVAVNVFTAADIAAVGIERPQGFIDLTPNMTLVRTQNQGLVAHSKVLGEFLAGHSRTAAAAGSTRRRQG